MGGGGGENGSEEKSSCELDEQQDRSGQKSVLDREEQAQRPWGRARLTGLL